MSRFAALVTMALYAPFAQGATISKGDVSFNVGTKPAVAGGIDGKLNEVSGTPKIEGGKLSGDFIINTVKFKTGNGLRDDHLKDWLGKNKCGDAKLELAPVDMNGEQPVSGKLHFCGKSTNVAGTGKFTATTAKISFGFKLKQDLGIDPATAMYETVGATEAVSVVANVSLVP